MPCPFPGMDPYIERPRIWPDFHAALVAAIRGLLQPVLRPRYAALMQDRLYVVNDDQLRKPDVSVVRSPLAGDVQRGASTAMFDVDTPAIFELYREEVREPYLEIVETADENKVVTAIEVLSPANKRPGQGRTSYLTKREQFAALDIHTVEIEICFWRDRPRFLCVPKKWNLYDPGTTW